MTDLDRRTLTFRQAEGLDPLPSPVALGTLTQEARALLWSVIYTFATTGTERDSSTGWDVWLSEDWRTALLQWHVRRQFRPVDEFNPRCDAYISWLKDKVYRSSLPDLFEFLTFLMRCGALNYLEAHFADAFEESRLAYRIEESTIYPKASEEEAAAIKQAFADLKEVEYNAARSHLRLAAECINGGEWAASVRESIHSVESVARVIEPTAATLSDALRKLNTTQRINPNLKRGLEALYNYSSDEKGIRHAKVFEAEAQVDQADAVYMLGAAAAFVSYLIARSRA